MSRGVAFGAAVALCAAVLVGCQAGIAQPNEPSALDSLRQLDDHPLWTMEYRDGYNRLTSLVQPPTPTPFSCSLFVANGDSANPVFARNFDWDHNPALLLFTYPPDAYASVSMVDISYLGVRSAEELGTADGRRRLMDAPLLPFDGMNEKGLTIGLAAVPEARPEYRADRPTVGGVRIIRLVLDLASTVDEAVAVVNRHNIDFAGGPPLHYLVADASGRSAVLEFVDGKLVAQPTEGAWQAAVNFTLTGSDAAARRTDSRYRTASEALDNAAGALPWRQAMDLLGRVAQGHTQWSVVYGLKTGEVHLSTDRRFGTVHELRLPMS